MATIGLRYPIWSPYASGGSGAPIVYGTAVTGDSAIEASIIWNRNKNELYADDMVKEYDNSILSGEITFGYDNLSSALKASMLGETETSVGSKIYEISDAAAPHGGFGYIKVVRSAGVNSYEAYWYHDVQFALDGESAKTRGENIEWQTPTVTGKIYGVDLDGSGKFKFRTVQAFTTYSAAKTYLDNLA